MRLSVYRDISRYNWNIILKLGKMNFVEIETLATKCQCIRVKDVSQENTVNRLGMGCSNRCAKEHAWDQPVFSPPSQKGKMPPKSEKYLNIFPRQGKEILNPYIRSNGYWHL